MGYRRTYNALWCAKIIIAICTAVHSMKFIVSCLNCANDLINSLLLHIYVFGVMGLAGKNCLEPVVFVVFLDYCGAGERCGGEVAAHMVKNAIGRARTGNQ